MSLLDVLGCPLCKSAVRRSGNALTCVACSREYPIVDGIPVMLTTPQNVVHEGELNVWPGYGQYIQQFLDSAPRDRAILDMGAGNRDYNDPRIVRMDVVMTPHVDVVGDAHALPFQNDSLAIVFSTAVFEHLCQPFEAARQIWNVLQPGGHVYADCNFVFPFHGYPAVYFNASLEGLRQLFQEFTEIVAAVAPWQMPSFAVRAILGEYLRLFSPESDRERAFVEALQELAQHPLEEFDQRFSQAEAARLAAGVTLIGAKRKGASDSLVPAPVQAAWARLPDLQRRYPQPWSLCSSLGENGPESLMAWAYGPGRMEHPEIADWIDNLRPWSKQLPAEE